MKSRMDASSLKDFVREALARGVGRGEIARGLRQAGWPEKEIEDGLEAFVDAGLPLPVPRCRASGSPREAFLHLLMFFSLGVWVTALGSLLFDFINIRLPLPGESGGSAASSLRFGVASLVVAFPVFALTMRRVRAELAANPARTLNPVRRWLSYFALLVASVILLGDGVSLVVQFLGGDLTLRFILKAGVVAALAGGVSWWLLGGLREETRSVPSFARFALFALVAAVAVVAVWVAGGPLQARAQTLDEQRVQDLRGIYSSVNSFYRQQKRLPASLAECDRSPETFIERKTDPVTSLAYDYAVVDADTFSIAAAFDLPSRPEKAGSYGPEADGFWKHDAGLTVFKIDVAASNGD
jgi:hypothetical protein